MNFYDEIFRRKSIRKYNMTALSVEELVEIIDFSEQMKPLYEDIKVDYVIESQAKNILPVKAPHYFMILSEKKEGYLINIGFMFQQMSLFLSQKGYGSCWLGMAKPYEKTKKKLDFVIVLCFGKPNEPLYREINAFKRKALTEISSGDDARLEAARLAPSSVNSQNWFFVCDHHKIHIYQKNLGRLKVFMYSNLNQIDIGIALCHLYIATKNKEKVPIITKEKDIKERKNYKYRITIE